MRYFFSFLLLLFIVSTISNKVNAQLSSNFLAAPIKMDVDNPTNCYDKPVTMYVPNGLAELDAYRVFYPTIQFFWYYGRLNPTNPYDTIYTYFKQSYDSSITFIPRIAFSPLGGEINEIDKQTSIPIKVHLTDKFTAFKISAANPIKFNPSAPFLKMDSIISTPSCANVATGTIKFLADKSFDTALYIVRYGNYLGYCNPETNNPPCFNVLTSGFITNNDTITLQGVPAGSYTVLLVNKGSDIGICNNVYSVFVPPMLPIQVDSTKIKQVQCYGENNGKIKLYVKNGTPRTYRFSITSNNQEAGTSFPFNYLNGIATFSNLVAGNYTINFTDTCGVIITKQVTIKQPPKVMGTISITPPTCHSPANGTIKIQANYNFFDTAFTKFNFHIYKDSILIKTVLNTRDSIQILDTFIGGNFKVIISSPNNPDCDGYIKWFNLPPNKLGGTVVQKTITSCYGSNDALLTIKGIGGSTLYNYFLLNNQRQQLLTDTSGKFLNLAAGNYTAIIKNKNNTCTDSATIAIVILQPDSILVTLNKRNVQCYNENNGTIKANVIGGNGGYRYTWERKLFNGSWSTIPTNFDSIINLLPGIYRAKITDSKNCLGTSLETTITQPDSLIIDSVKVNDIACFNQFGSIKIYCKGGNSNHVQEYRKLPASLYTAFTDTTKIPVGLYVVRVVDINGCIATFKDTFNITSPSNSLNFTYVQPAVNGYNISCFGADDATLTVTATGGNGYTYSGYTYRFDNNNWQTNNILTNIPAGIRQIAVKDARGCIVTKPVSFLQPNDSLKISLISKTDIQCFGDSTGSITLQATGGVLPYRFSKDGGLSYQANGIFTGLPAGAYNVDIKDANNCTGLVTLNLVNTNAIITANESITNVSCFGGADGSIISSASGGVSPYTINWMPNNSSNIGVNNLTFGNYTLKITDALGCNRVFNYIVRQPNQLLPQTTANPVCFGATTSFIKIKPIGGTAPFTYSKDDGTTWQADSTFTNLVAGIYSIKVKDSKGCLFSKKDTIHTIVANPNLNFIVSSNQRVGDTITMKEISWIRPDSINWFFDARATVISANRNEPKIKFTTTDSSNGYLIRLKGFYPTCTYSKEKYVKIFAYDSNAVVTSSSFNRGIKLAELFPNPNNGSFTLNVEFFKLQRAKVYISHLWGFPIGAPTVFEPSLKILKNFTNALNGHPPGTYMVRIVSDFDTRYLLFVKYE